MWSLAMLMSNKERRFMWNLAFFFTNNYVGATAFESLYAIRPFITFTESTLVMGAFGNDKREKIIRLDFCVLYI